MIVDTMTNSEIAEVCNKEWRGCVMPFIQRTLSDKRYARYILKNIAPEQKFYFKPVEYNTKYGNTYILLPNTKGKRDFKKYGLLYTCFMLYRKNSQFHAVMPMRINGGLHHNLFAMYSPHLFDRYRERELRNMELSKKDTIIDFFKNNATNEFTGLNNPKYVNSVFAVSSTGVILGSLVSNNILECKTYITFDMLKGCQITNKNSMADDLCRYMDTLQQDYWKY